MNHQHNFTFLQQFRSEIKFNLFTIQLHAIEIKCQTLPQVKSKTNLYKKEVLWQKICKNVPCRCALIITSLSKLRNPGISPV